MEQSLLWEVNRFWASQEIPRILWDSKVQYHVYKCPPPVHTLSEISPAHAAASHFLKIHLSIILPSMTGSSKWSLFLRFPHKNPVYASHLPHTRYMPRLSHSSRFYHPNNVGWGIQIIKLFIMYFSPLPCFSLLIVILFTAKIWRCITIFIMIGSNRDVAHT